MDKSELIYLSPHAYTEAIRIGFEQIKPCKLCRSTGIIRETWGSSQDIEYKCEKCNGRGIIIINEHY